MSSLPFLANHRRSPAAKKKILLRFAEKIVCPSLSPHDSLVVFSPQSSWMSGFRGEGFAAARCVPVWKCEKAVRMRAMTHGWRHEGTAVVRGRLTGRFMSARTIRRGDERSFFL